MPKGNLSIKASLEERIKCIIHMPELEMEGNAYKGKYELNDFGSIKDFMLKKLRIDEKGKKITYTNQSTGDEIIISHEAAGEIAGYYKSSEAYQKVIAHIPKIIENMQFLEEMKADKEKAKFDKYSYYVTPVKIDGESYTILSTVGRNRQEIYYYQNVFKGTPEKVFEETENETNVKYSRLNKILKNAKIEKRQLEADPGHTQEAPTAYNSKYNKFSEEKQGKNEKILIVL
jgi:uncharacterized protein YukE